MTHWVYVVGFDARVGGGAEKILAASCGMNMTGSNHDHGYENCPGYFSILSPSFEHLELSLRAALVIVK